MCLSYHVKSLTQLVSKATAEASLHVARFARLTDALAGEKCTCLEVSLRIVRRHDNENHMNDMTGSAGFLMERARSMSD